MSSLLFARRRFAFLLVIVLAVLTVALGGDYFDAEATPVSVTQTRVSSGSANLIDLAYKKPSCCDTMAETASFSPLTIPQYDTYRLTATYYSLREDLTTTLMLNNKGAQPILAIPTIYSLAGTPLQLPPITVPATSFIDVNMPELINGAGDEFREGSIKIAYNGISQQLGAQIKMVDTEHDLIWAEQFVYTSKFVSNRLENLWWLPYENSKMKVVVSNTSGGVVNVNIAVEGTSPNQSAPIEMSLAPWETRVFDIMRDLVGHENGDVREKGGISITHSSAPGDVLARMFVAKPNNGYSASESFVDPGASASRRWHGNGLRFRNLNGAKLTPVVIVRNTGGEPSHLTGKIIYTQTNGEVTTINFPPRTIGPRQTEAFELKNLVEDLPNSVKFGGIELEYDTPKGTVIASLQSVSQNGRHVFQVPMFDPANLPSSAGGFPWKVDGDFTTIVYIKNETDSAKKFAIHLRFDGGGYSAGMKTIKPDETMAFDFRKMRDEQVADALGRVIPLGVEKGQISWGVHGAENKVMSGRSEQISLINGVASTYACANCCPPVIYTVSVNPEEASTSVGNTTAFLSTQTDMDCNNQESVPYPSDSVVWQSYNTNIASIDSGGTASALDVGETTIQGTVERTIWFNWGGGYCEPLIDYLNDQAPMEVVGVQKIQYKGPNNSAYADATGTLYVLKDTEVSFKAIPNPSTATFPSGQPVWSGSSGATGTGQTISVTFSAISSSAGNFKTVIATAGSSSITVDVVVYSLEKVVTPTDNFEGRAPTTFGLKEFVDLSATITPSGVTAAQIGGLQWSITSGTGTLESNQNNDGTGSFTAPASPANTTFKLAVLSGPSKDRNITQDVTTIAPSGTRLVLSTGRRHTQNVVGAGFKAIVYFDPKNVSFKNIQFNEGVCDATTSGYLSGLGTPHAAGPNNLILLCNSSTGCRGLNEDSVYLGHPTNPSPTPFATGSWNWPIPWFYHSGGSPGSLYTINQLLTTDASGNATISKGGASVTFNVNDATVSW